MNAAAARTFKTARTFPSKLMGQTLPTACAQTKGKRCRAAPGRRGLPQGFSEAERPACVIVTDSSKDAKENFWSPAEFWANRVGRDGCARNNSPPQGRIARTPLAVRAAGLEIDSALGRFTL